MILFSFIGAILYRMRGGWPSITRPIEQCLFCLPVLVLAFDYPLWGAILAYALSVAACLIGHGHTMSLKAPVDKTKLERYEFFTKWLIGKIPDYWYKVIAHGFGGFIVTLPLFLCNPLAAMAGWLKAPAYMIGWYLHPNYNDGKIKLRIGKLTFDSATAIGEGLTGLFIWAVLIGAM